MAKERKIRRRIKDTACARKIRAAFREAQVPDRAKRACALVLAMAMLITACFSSLPDGSLSFLGKVGQQISEMLENQEALASDTITFTITPVADTGGAHVWALDGRDEELSHFTTSQGLKAYCLNSGMALSHYDAYSYTTMQLSTYARMSTVNTYRAIILTWQEEYSSGWSFTHTYANGNTKTFSLTGDQVQTVAQVMLWDSGVTSINDQSQIRETVAWAMTVYLSESTGYTSAAIGMIFDQLYYNVLLAGEIGDYTLYQYSLASCGHSGGTDRDHQILIGLGPGITTESEPESEPKSEPESEPDPITATYSDSTEAETETEYSLTVYKKDSISKNLLDTAGFNISVTGVSGASALSVVTGSLKNGVYSTSGGKVTVKFTASVSTGTVSSGTFTYVTNWNELSSQKQAEIKKNHTNWYTSKGAAVAAANKALNEKLAEALKGLSFGTATWTVTEVSAPAGHSLPDETTKTKTSSGGSATLTFYDTPDYIPLYLTKKVTKGYTSDRSLAKATYGVYAGETVYDPTYSGTSKVLYEKDELITKITTDKNGEASVSKDSHLLPAGYNYYVKELVAPDGYLLDTETYEMVDETADEWNLTVYDTPAYGMVKIYKTYEEYDNGVTTTSPELEAQFVLQDSDGSPVTWDGGTNVTYNGKTYSVIKMEGTAQDTSGQEYAYGYSGEIPCGTYTIIQIAGTDKAQLAADTVVKVSANENNENLEANAVEVFATNRINVLRIGIMKTLSDTDTVEGTTTYTPEADARFIVLDAASVVAYLKTVNGSGVTDTASALAYLSALDADDLTGVAAGRDSFVAALLKAYPDAVLTVEQEDTGNELATSTGGYTEAAFKSNTESQEYIILQTQGTAGYYLHDAESDVTAANDSSVHYYYWDNKSDGRTVSITKKKAAFDGTEEGYENATFYVLEADNSLISAVQSFSGSTDIKDLAGVREYLAGLTKERRAAFIASLTAAGSGTILGEIKTTSTNGTGSIYWNANDYDGAFLVLQTEGEKGYGLMDPVLSTDAVAAADAKATDETTYTKGSRTTDYSITHTDIYEDWGYLALYKYYQASNASSALLNGTEDDIAKLVAEGVIKPEEGAEFSVYDSDGKLVATITTDASGYGEAIDPDTGKAAVLPYGGYTIKQTKGKDGWQLITEQYIEISSESQQATLVLSCINAKDTVPSEVVKTSTDTGAPVEGASYTITAAEAVYEVLYGGTQRVKYTDDAGTETWSETKLTADLVSSELIYSEGEKVATLMTGADGKITLSLPYGTYKVTESASPDTFVKDTNTYTVRIDESGITLVSAVDEDDNDITADYAGILSGSTLNVSDTPVFGEIWIDKSGQVVAGAGESSSFTMGTAGVEGATYALYAAADILDDAGNLVQYIDPDTGETKEMKEGALISYAVTGADGSVQFGWTKYSQYTGETTDETDFYLGDYYIIEVESPYGWAQDTIKHTLTLTWDLTAGSMDDYDADKASGSTNSRNVTPSTGEYFLEQGEDLNGLLTTLGVTSVSFTNSVPFTVTRANAKGASGKTSGSYYYYDVSADQDGSVILYYYASAKQYVYITPILSGTNTSSTVIDQVAYMNAESAYMFSGLTKLSSVLFDNIDTSYLVDADYMFYNCSTLTTLDLSNWNTTSLEYVNSMFRNCTSLATIYVRDDTVIGLNPYTDGEIAAAYASSTKIYTSEYHKASGAVVDADDILWSDFTYMVEDADGIYYLLELTEDDIESVTPATADSSYASQWLSDGYFTMTVGITLKGDYADIGTIYADVLVCYPDGLDIELLTTDHPVVTVGITEKEQTINISIDKVDDEGNPVGGAEFTLYANCTIVDDEGNTIYKYGDAIMTVYTPESTTKYDTGATAMFAGLPSNLYAKEDTYNKVDTSPEDGVVYLDGDASSEFMYYVKETTAAPGYKGTDRIWYATGSVESISGTSQASVNLYAYYEGDISNTDAAVNTPLLYPTLVKEWDDEQDAEDSRPEWIMFTASGYGSYIIWMSEDTTELYDYSTAKAYTTHKQCAANCKVLSTWDTVTYTDKTTGFECWSVVLDNEGSPSVNYFALTKSSSGKVSCSWTFTENTTALKAESTKYTYDSASSGYDAELKANNIYVWKAYNYMTPEYTRLTVTKEWDDEDDEFGLRPDYIVVKIYRWDSKGNKVDVSTTTDNSGNSLSKYAEVILSEENLWSYTTDRDLPSYDSSGNSYTYTVEEAYAAYSDGNGGYDVVSIAAEKFSSIYTPYYYVTDSSGNAVGYMSEEEIENSTDYTMEDASSYDQDSNLWTCKIENGTTTDLGLITVTKRILAADIDWNKGNPEFTFSLRNANGAVLKDINGNYLTGTVTFTQELECDEEGYMELEVKFSPLDPGTYYLMESQSGDYEFKSLTITSGTGTVGTLSGGVFEEDEDGETAQIITGSENTKVAAEYVNGALTGRVDVKKRILADEIDWTQFDDGDGPSFAFTLSGMTESGDTYTKTETLTFTKEKVNALTDSDGYVQLETAFTKLEPGTYTLSEESLDGTYRFRSLAAESGTLIDSENGEESTSGDSVTFVLTDGNMKASFVAEYTNEAKSATVTAYKRIYADDVEWDNYADDDGPTFTFTLTGYNSEGTQIYKESHPVTITKADAEAAEAAVDAANANLDPDEEEAVWDGYVEVAAEYFTGLKAGTYYLTEAGMEDTYKFVSVAGAGTVGTLDSSGAFTEDEDGAVAKIEVGDDSLDAEFEIEYTNVSTLGKISVAKKVIYEDIEWDDFPDGAVFSFTLTGETDDGDAYAKTDSITLTEDAAKALAEAAEKAAEEAGEEWDGYISLSLTFAELKDGTYYLTEEESDAYTLESMSTADGTVGTITEGVFEEDSDGDVIRFIIEDRDADAEEDSPSGTEEEESGGMIEKSYSANVINSMVKGEITVTKRILESEAGLEEGGEVSFSFTLVGTTDKGEDYAQTQTVTFTADETVYDPDDGDYIIATATFTDLEYGTYTLSESAWDDRYRFESLTAENGTIIDEETGKEYTGATGTSGQGVQFTLSKDNRKAEFTAAYTDKRILGKVTIMKYGEGNKTLDGVWFTLYRLAGVYTEEELKEAEEAGESIDTSDAIYSGGTWYIVEPDAVDSQDTVDGMATFENLDPGDYLLLETSTVDGYNLLADVVTFSILSTYDDSEAEGLGLDTSNALRLKTADGTYVWAYEEVWYNIKNGWELDLPLTGESNGTGLPTWGTLAGLALLVLALIASLRKKEGGPHRPGPSGKKRGPAGMAAQRDTAGMMQDAASGAAMPPGPPEPIRAEGGENDD